MFTRSVLLALKPHGRRDLLPGAHKSEVAASGFMTGIFEMSFARSSPLQVFSQPLGEDGEEFRIELLGELPVF